MSWRMIINCHICGATEHRVMADDDEPSGHMCRATAVGEGLVTL